MHFRNGNLSLIIWIRWRQKYSTLKMKIFGENVELNFFRMFEVIIEWIFFSILNRLLVWLPKWIIQG